jgi:hypothetical protein
MRKFEFSKHGPERNNYVYIHQIRKNYMVYIVVKNVIFIISLNSHAFLFQSLNVYQNAYTTCFNLNTKNLLRTVL